MRKKVLTSPRQQVLSAQTKYVSNNQYVGRTSEAVKQPKGKYKKAMYTDKIYESWAKNQDRKRYILASQTNIDHSEFAP